MFSFAKNSSALTWKQYTLKGFKSFNVMKLLLKGRVTYVKNTKNHT